MKPLIRIAIVIIVVCTVCSISMFVFNKGVKQFKNHTTEKFDELFLNKTHFDILFVGSSRTHNDINPRIVDSILKTNSYNAGIGGANMTEFNLVVEAFLVNHPPPKIIVLTIDLHSFAIIHPLADYTNYFGFTDNAVVKNELVKYKYDLPIHHVFPFLHFIDYDDYSRANALRSFMNKNYREVNEGEFQYRGYISNNTLGIATDTAFTGKRGDNVVSDSAIQNLKNIVSICAAKNIKLIFTYAPEYKFYLQARMKNNDKIFGIINHISVQNKIPFYRHDSLAMCTNRLYFANILHLTTSGATEYSSILSNILKQYLDN